MNEYKKLRVLAIFCNFKWSHIDYLNALSNVVDLRTAWSGEAHEGAVNRAVKEGLDMRQIGVLGKQEESTVAAQLKTLIAEYNPDLIHLMYYYNEQLTCLTRKITGNELPIIFECRDPITTLRTCSSESLEWKAEAKALEVSDGQILVSEKLKQYYQETHDIDLNTSSLIVPHCFASRAAGPAQTKFSRSDGRTHLALVGSVQPNPQDNRYYVNIIRKLVSTGVVVHSHFFIYDDKHNPYIELAEELEDYHYKPTVTSRGNLDLSNLISQYDLMGVFHELEANGINESRTLTVCMPTKAVCGWYHGAIPIVCFKHYEGLLPWIKKYGTGFIIEDLRRYKRYPAR